MTRTRLAAVAVVTLGLLAPVAAASSASAAPQACGASAKVKDHKINNANAKARDARTHGKKKGHSKPAFVHAGKVTAVDPAASTLSFVVRGGQVKALRGCTLTVVVTAATKINRNDAAAALGDIAVGDHVNVKGTSARDATTGAVTYTATRVSAEAPHSAG